MSSKILTGVNANDNVSYKFREDDIEDIGLTPEYQKDLQLVATILACNIEEAQLQGDGTVDIVWTSFNDGYYDMMAELTGEDDEEDEDEDFDE